MEIQAALDRAMKITSSFSSMGFRDIIDELGVAVAQKETRKRTALNLYGLRRHDRSEYSSVFSWYEISDIWTKVGKKVQGDVELVGKDYLSLEAWIATEEPFLSLYKKGFDYKSFGTFEDSLKFSLDYLSVPSLTLYELEKFTLFSNYNEKFIRSELYRVRDVFDKLRRDLSDVERLAWTLSWPKISNSGNFGKLIHFICAFPVTFSNGDTSVDLLRFTSEQQQILLALLAMRIERRSDQPDILSLKLSSIKEFRTWLHDELSWYPRVSLLPISLK